MIPKPDKPFWSGPYEGGITQSLLIRFCECPFRFYLYAYCGLKEAEESQENLIWGDTFHKGLEHLIRGDSLHDSMCAMYAYFMAEYPTAPSTYIYTCFQMLKLYPLDVYITWDKPNIITEKHLHKELHLPGIERPVIARGKVDVTDSVRLCDHKCKGTIYPMETLLELNTDLQMNLYGYILGTEQWQYDLIRIPESKYSGAPDRRGGETPEAYANRLFTSYNYPDKGYPINNYRFQWISQLPYTQPKHKMEEYYSKTIAPLVRRVCRWWDKVNEPNFDPNSPEYYDEIFYQMPARMFDPSRTDKFKPHFHGILTEQQTYEDLLPVKSFYAELEDI